MGEQNQRGCTHTHTSFIISKENKGRLPVSGKDASHLESHVDADSVLSVSTLGVGENISTHSHFSINAIGISYLHIHSQDI
jgi:hypothetical protein